MNQIQKFYLMVDALGDSATAEQSERLLSWAVHNLPRLQWDNAAAYACSIGDFYTDMRERMSECGVAA